MSKLAFNPIFKSNLVQTGGLPVEVRKDDLTLAARGLTSQEISLDPGEYFVTAALPGGQEMHGRVKVEQDEPATVDLILDPEFTSLTKDAPSYISDVSQYIWGMSGYVSALESLGTAPEAKLRAFRGNILRGDVSPLVEEDPPFSKPNSPTPAGVTIFRPSSSEATLVQMLQPDSIPINMALPERWYPCYVAVTLQAGNSFSLSVHLSREEVEALLRYMEQGKLMQTAELANSNALQAETLFERKGVDTLGATVGAYALLQLGALDRLHNWTANLLNWFEDLPDAVPIRAEHLARLGDHKGALEVLLQMPNRDLPYFSDGLSYALDRLRLYTGAGRKHFEEAQLNQAQALLDQLTRFEPYVDFSKAFLTFSGLDPAHPDDNILEGFDYDTYEGVLVQS